jgi:hypothetical protein
MKKLNVLAAMLLPLVLVACGGGSNDTSTSSGDPVDAYVGNWRGCLSVDVNSWQIVEVTTTKLNANGGTTLLKGFDSYSDAACTKVTQTQNDPAQPRNFTLTGAVQVQGKSGHRLQIAGTRTINFVYALSGNQLYIANTDGPSDAEGYPTTLINEPLIKR